KQACDDERRRVQRQDVAERGKEHRARRQPWMATELRAIALEYQTQRRGQARGVSTGFGGGSHGRSQSTNKSKRAITLSDDGPLKAWKLRCLHHPHASVHTSTPVFDGVVVI